jgi:peptide/nickel transport system ATP-binding protein
MEGEPPSPIDLPQGCAFRSRCPQAFEACLHHPPFLTVRGARDLAACHRVPGAGAALLAGAA